MIGPLENMRLHEDEFTKSDKLILDYVEENLEIIASHSILDVADMIQVSKSALLRFCKKCGYSGYSELKYDVSRFLLSGKGEVDDEQNHIHQLLSIYTDRIANLESSISEAQLLKLSEMIMNARKIKIFGMHETGLSASYLEFRLMNLGFDCESVSVPNLMAEKASFGNKEDLHIFFSISGITKCILDGIQTSIEKNAQTVVITSNPHNDFKDDIDLMLLFPTVDNYKRVMFIDSQAIIFVVAEMIVSMLAQQLKIKYNKKEIA